MADNSPMMFREFLKSMTREDIKRYAGQWIAVASGEIVAHGKDPGRVINEGYEAGKGEPFMEYIYASLEEIPAFPSIWMWDPPIQTEVHPMRKHAGGGTQDTSHPSAPPDRTPPAASAGQNPAAG